MASGVGDFMDGVHMSRASDILDQRIPYENLTQEQKGMIRNETRYMSTALYLEASKYFLAYPQIYKLENNHLSALLTSDTVEQDYKEKVLDKYIDLCVFRFITFRLDVPYSKQSTDWIYEYLIQSWDRVKIEENALQFCLLEEFYARENESNYRDGIFNWESNYPSFFKDFVASVRPNYTNSIGVSKEEIKNKITDYLSGPNNIKYEEIRISLFTLQDENDRASLLQEIGELNYSSTFTEHLKKGIADKKIKLTENYSSAKDIGDELSKDLIIEIQALKQGLSIKDSKYVEAFNNEEKIMPFFINYGDSGHFGEIFTPYFFGDPVDLNVINSLENVIKQKEYISIFKDSFDYSYFCEQREIQYDSSDLKRPFFIVGSDDGLKWEDLSHVLEDSIKTLQKEIKFSEENIVKNIWDTSRKTFGVYHTNNVYEKLIETETLKLKEKDFSSHEVLNFMRGELFQNIMQEAGGALWDASSNHLQSKLISSEEIKNKKLKRTNLREANGFYVEVVNQILNQIPPQLLSTLSKVELGLDGLSYKKSLFNNSFFLLSGLFPCNLVLERFMDYKYDMERMKDVLQCLGDVRATRAKANEFYREKQNKVDEESKEGIEEGIQKGEISVFTIKDFPEIQKHVNKMLEEHATDDVTKKRMSERVGNVNVYVINEEYFLSLLKGEDSSMSPKKVAGYYSPTGGALFPSACIVVYKRSYGTSAQEEVLKNLGIPSQTEGLSIGEENTLWHEFAHAIMNEIVPGGYNDEIGNIAEWMQSPSEVAAITLGNLPHIRNLIYNYFTNNLPLNKEIHGGLIQKMKVDLIETFIEEFYGMKKADAIRHLEQQNPEINEDLMEELNTQSNEEKVRTLTNIFTEFFMGKYLRGKVESLWEELLKGDDEETSKRDIDFKELEEIVNPETIGLEYNPLEKDKWIKELSNDPSYNLFLQKCQQLVQQDYEYMYNVPSNRERFWSLYKPYVHRYSPNQLIIPTRIGDLLLLMFGPPATVFRVDMKTLNPMFGQFIPQNLLDKVKKIVENERLLISGQEYEDSQSTVTPDEAEEFGKFVSEYGEDVMWLASNKFKIYKISKTNN